MRCHKPYFRPDSNFTFWAASGGLQKGSGDLKNGFCQKSFQDIKFPPKSADPAKFHGLKLKNMENMTNSQWKMLKETAPYNFTRWSSPWPPTVPPACSWPSDRSEDHENAPKWFFMPKNLGLDTKFKCLAWPEAKLRLFDSFWKTLGSSTKLGFRFWRVVDTFFKDMNKCI